MLRNNREFRKNKERFVLFANPNFVVGKNAMRLILRGSEWIFFVFHLSGPIMENGRFSSLC